MKKIIMFAVATMLTISVFAKPIPVKKSTKKACPTECKGSKCAKDKCTKEKCPQQKCS